MECRRANRLYQRSRETANAAGFNNPLIDAAETRRHLVRLADRGIGSRTVAALSGLGRTLIANVKSGRATRLRKRHAIRLLAVPLHALAPGSKVPAGPTWERVRYLVEDAKWTKVRIAEAIGQQRALQLGREWVTKEHEAAIRGLVEPILAQPRARNRKRTVRSSAGSSPPRQ